MSKNIITGVLLVTVFVMGFALVSTQSRLQQATVLDGAKTSVSAPTSTLIKDVVAANEMKEIDGIYKSSGKLSDEMRDRFPTLPKEMLCQVGSENGVLYNGECVSVSMLPDILTATPIDPLDPAEQKVTDETCVRYEWSSFTIQAGLTTIVVVYRYCAERAPHARAI